jgi:von Willebrand factor type A domain
LSDSLPEPLPRGELAGRDQLARRTAELASQEEPVIRWQRTIAAEIMPWVGDDGVLIAGSLGIDIPTGHARPYLPASGQRREEPPALPARDWDYLDNVRFGTWPPVAYPVYVYDSSGNLETVSGTEAPGASGGLREAADVGGQVRLTTCHDGSGSLAVGLAGVEYRNPGRAALWLILHPPAGPGSGGDWRQPAFLGSTDRHVVLVGVELGRPPGRSPGNWVMVAVHDRVSGRPLWGHRWRPPGRQDARTADAADITGEALLTREGAFVRARHLDNGRLLWSAVPPPRYGGFAGSGRHPASQWARLAAPGPGQEAGLTQAYGEAEDLFLHSLTGRILSVRGAFHHTRDDLVLTRVGHALTCLALPPDPQPLASRPSAVTARTQGWRIDLDGGAPAAGGEASLLATVTMTGTPPRHAVTRAAEVFIIDMSDHMDHAWLAPVREAITAALGRLRSGTLFAIIAGGDSPSMVYPAGDKLALADRRTIAEASRAMATLTGGQGHAAVGRLLRHARLLLEPHPKAIRHVQFLVAGRFSGESAQQVASSIQQCAGIFACDCRGIGVNWEVGEVRKISSALLGTLDIVPDPQGLKAELVAMTDNAMSKTAAGIFLRLRTTSGARIRSVKQVAPVVEDLTGRGTTHPDDPAAQDYPTGAWRPGETREYHIGLGTAPPELESCVTAAVRDAQGGTWDSSSLWMLLAGRPRRRTHAGALINGATTFPSRTVVSAAHRLTSDIRRSDRLRGKIGEAGRPHRLGVSGVAGAAPHIRRGADAALACPALKGARGDGAEAKRARWPIRGGCAVARISPARCCRCSR